MVVAMVAVRIARRAPSRLLVLGSALLACENAEQATETPRASATAMVQNRPPGEVAWSKSGQVLVGPNRELYRLDIDESRNRSSVSRLLPDGTARWERSYTGTEVSISTSCIFGDGLIVEQTRQIQSIDPLSGREEWSLNPNAGVLGGGLVATAYCFGPSSDYIAIVAGQRGASSLSLVRRTTGRLQWRLLDLPLPPYPVALFPRYLVVHSSGPNTQFVTLDAYFVGPGRPLLAHTLTLPRDAFLVGGGAYEKLYACYQLSAQPTFTLARIEPSTVTLGKPRVLEDEEYPSMDAGKLRLDGPNSVTWLDSTSLATIWSYRAPAPLVYTYAALTSGKYIMTYTTGSNTAELAYLDPWAQENPVWVRACPTVPCSASGDPKGGVYLSDAFTLHALNQSDGNDLWTYVAPESPSNLSNLEAEGKGGIEDVIDVDENGAYVLFRGPGYKCPPMGVAALGPPRTSGGPATVRWEDAFDRNVSWVKSDAGNLYVSLSECSPFGTIAAIKK